MKKDQTNKRFWERFAGVYTGFMKKNDASYRKMCAIFEKYLREDMKVLELACGTGQMTFLLADRVKSWDATDFSEQMILEAEKRNHNPNIHFRVQDATNLTYDDQCFDAVVIANALHIMSDLGTALKEIHRVLKEDGILYSPTFVYEKEYSKILIWLMEKAGFQTFHKWKKSEFIEYVCAKRFVECEHSLIEGKPLPECALICRKQSR